MSYSIETANKGFLAAGLIFYPSSICTTICWFNNLACHKRKFHVLTVEHTIRNMAHQISRIVSVFSLFIFITMNTPARLEPDTLIMQLTNANRNPCIINVLDWRKFSTENYVGILTVFDPRLSIVMSVFDCCVSGMMKKETHGIDTQPSNSANAAVLTLSWREVSTHR